MSAKRVEDILGARLDEIMITRAAFGLFFSGVKLSTGQGGLCFTPLKSIPEAVCCPSSAKAMPLSGKLAGRKASEYLSYIESDNMLKKTLGIAALNALSTLIMEEGGMDQYELLRSTDAFDILDLVPGQKTVVVGALVPVFKKLIKGENEFTILEMDPRTLKGKELDHYLPAERAEEVVPYADLLVITGTTLINNTLDGLLAMAKKGARILVTGPTVSMLPDVLFEHGVTMVGGIIVTDPDAALDIICEAGSGYHMFGTSAERTVIRKK